MNNRQHGNNGHRNRGTAAGWFAASVGVCLFGTAGFGTASAQSTSGHIFGQAPAGETVTVQSRSGFHRHMTVKDNGRYTINALPLGVYAVTLEKDGTVVDRRANIPITVGRGAEVDFACPRDQCAAPQS